MIRFLLNAYSFIIIADVILSYMPHYKNEPWAKMIRQAAGYTLNPIRKYLPQDIPVDISPLIVLILIQLIPSLW